MICKVYRVMIKPNQIAINPRITLAKVYRKAEITSPFNPRLKVSNEKVEKVVKPPQKPTIRSAFNLGGIAPVLPNSPKSNPNKKQPKILMVKVASGNGAFHIFKNKRLTRYLHAVPKKPPAPARSTIFHISFTLKDVQN